jgi:hypothetical protein
MEKAGAILMSDVNNIPWYTSLDLEMFNDLVEESTPTSSNQGGPGLWKGRRSQ